MISWKRLKRKFRKKRRKRDRKSIHEQLEPRRVLASSFTNLFNAFDVNDDGAKSSLDVLQVINRLNTVGAGPLPRASEPDPPPFVDISGDGELAPNDALLGINELNRGELGTVVALFEGGEFAKSESRPVDLAVQEGTRLLSFEVRSRFDQSDTEGSVEDTFNVYLTDPSNPAETLLDHGATGTAVFSLSGPRADFIPGLVRYDGTRVEIDTSSLVSLSQGQLVFQLLSHDSDTGTRIAVSQISNDVDPNGQPRPAFPLQHSTSEIGENIDLDGATELVGAAVEFSSPRFAAASGRFAAELRVKNNGADTGRDVAILLPGLPNGVTVTNQSGITPGGDPILNVRDSVRSGGLQSGDRTDFVTLEIENAANVPFPLRPSVVTLGDNQPPLIRPVGALTVTPGDQLSVELTADDPDGDPLAYSIQADQELPNVLLTANPHLVVTPAPGDVGSYQFDIIASDGASETIQTVSLEVAADAITTTRLSGIVLNTDQQPLPGVPIELGTFQTTTAADGAFTLDLGDQGIGPEDALFIRGTELQGAESYPFIAERLKLLVEEGPFSNVNNVIKRPIFLPALDVASEVTIDPTQDTTLTSDKLAGAELFVRAGTLQNPDGSDYTGALSITEVPPELTPAALPEGVIPDTVVTIQPGELNFTTAAPLTLPNRGDLPPGSILDLLSIDPEIGDFGLAGIGQVSDDGSVIETISGGVTSSSWHVFRSGVVPVNGQNVLANQDQRGKERSQKAKASSDVETHSGVLTENHDLATYESLGEIRGLSLVYDSHRADPRHVLHQLSTIFTFGLADVRIIASATIRRGDVAFQVPGAEPIDTLSGGQHFWKPQGGESNFQLPLLADLTSQPSGVYEADLTSGAARFRNSAIQVGGTAETSLQFVHVSSIDSPFGAGWGIAGLRELVENPDGSVLLIDGDGSELVFGPAPAANQAFVSPLGDVTELMRLLDGTFERRYRNQTVERYTADGLLASITDSNGNQLRYEYDAENRIERMIDPVGLETTFTYSNGHLSDIRDPANRVTRLEHDASGNLVRIVDPDGSARTFGYDSLHHLLSEVDKRGNFEESVYNFAGRVTQTIQKDGTLLHFDPPQLKGLLPAAQTTDFENAPLAPVSEGNVAISTFADASGNVITTELDQRGQVVANSDLEGPLPRFVRDDQNRVTSIIDARGNITRLVLDDQDNLVSQQNGSGAGVIPRPVFGAPVSVLAGTNPVPTRAQSEFSDVGDVNKDGVADVVTVGADDDIVAVRLGIGDGNLGPEQQHDVGTVPQIVKLVDLDDDGNLDIVTANRGSLSILLGNGDGTFAASSEVTAFSNIRAMATGDVNGDAVPDVILGRGDRFEPATVTVLLGDGTGGLGDPISQEIFAGDHFADRNQLKVGDLNNDGLPDVAMYLASSFPRDPHRVKLLVSQGDGTFEESQDLSQNGFMQFYALADINDDGNLDLIAALDDKILVRRGNGSGGVGPIQQVLEVGFTLASPGVKVQDIDGDGNLDLLMSIHFNRDPGFAVSYGEGGLAFSPPQFVATDEPKGLFSADLNSDGKKDVIVVSGVSNGVIGIVPAIRARRFVEPQRLSVGPGVSAGQRHGIDVGDLNSDGRPDIVATTTAGTSIFLSAGPVIYRPVVHEPGSGSMIRLVDLNGDNHLDIVSSGDHNQNLFSRFRARLGNGDGTFAEAQVLDVGTSDHTLPGRFVIGDFNNDSIPDVAVSKRSSVALLVGNGDGTLALQSELPLGDGISTENVIGGGDLDADDNQDLVVFTRDGEAIGLFGDGNGNFTQQMLADLEISGIRDVATGDFNRDGRTDFAVVRQLGATSERALSVLLSEPNREMSLVAHSPLRELSDDTIRAVDIDSDQDVDLVVTESVLNSFRIFENNGDGTFNGEAGFFSGDQPVGLAFGDFDGNGVVDVISNNLGNRFTEKSLTLSLRGERNNLGCVGLCNNEFTYHPVFGNPTRFVDEVGGTTLFEYDENNGDLLSVTRVHGVPDAERTDGSDRDDSVTQYSYTPQGLLESVTDPLGRVTSLAHDEFGRVVRTTFAVGTSQEATAVAEFDGAGNITATIDENGNRYELEYDPLNRVTVARDPFGLETRFEYDAAGNLVADIDARGNSTQYEHDVFDRVVKTTDALGGVELREFDAAGNLVAYTNQLGATARSRFDARNRLTHLIDRAGGVTEFQYDADDNVTRRIDAVGNVFLTSYDARSRKASDTDPLGNTTEYISGGDDQLMAVVDALGRELSFTYDDLGGLIRETDALGNSDLTEYDNAGNVIREVDALGRETLYTYDARNRRMSETDPAGGTISFTYDNAGNLTTITDELGRVSRFTYDSLNRRVSATDPGGDTARFEYDAAGNLTATIDANGDTSTYTYDELNRATEIIDSLGGVITTTYDATGQVASTTDELGRTTTYEYDTLSRLVGETDSLGNTSRRQYDALSRVTAEIDSLGNRQVTEYDALSRISRVIDSTGGVTTRNYDPVGNLISLEDAVGNVTSFEYDALDRLTKRIDPLGAEETLAYDAEYNLISHVDRNGRETRRSYDALDRAIEELWLDQDDSVVNRITREYDLAGQILSVQDFHSAYEYNYTVDSLVASISNTGTPNVPTVEFAFEYDPVGNNTRVTESIDGTPTSSTDYAYDALARMTGIRQSGSDAADKRIDLAYNAAGQVVSIDRFSDLGGANAVASTTYTYDDGGRIQQLAHANGVPIASYDLVFDESDRLSQITSLADGVINFSYDQGGRLLQTEGNPPIQETFEYDAVGNPEGDQFVTGANNRLMSDETFDYTYDAEGNRTLRIDRATGNRTEYEWDHRNRLIRVIDKNDVEDVIAESQYAYDMFDRRIAKSVDSDGAGPGTAVTTHFVYVGPDLALVFDAAGERTERHLFGPEVDFPLASEDATGDTRWLLQDVRNNIVDVVSSAGQVLNHIVYSSFGQVISETNPDVASRFTYDGREVDPETGLIYLRARYLDPAVGQFISEDPIGFAGKDTNLYAYVFNSPISFGDPFGTDWVAEGLAGANAFFGGLADSFTLGATEQVREWIDPVTTKKARESALFTTGQATGTILQVASGTAAANGLKNSVKLGKQVKHMKIGVKKSVRKSVKKKGSKVRQKRRNDFRRNQRKKIQAKENKIKNIQRNQRAVNANLAINGGGASLNLALKAGGLNPCDPLNAWDFANPILVFVAFRVANRPGPVNNVDDIRANIRQKNFQRDQFRKEVQDAKNALQQQVVREQAALNNAQRAANQALDKVDNVFDNLARQQGFANEVAENAFIKGENQLIAAFKNNKPFVGNQLQDAAQLNNDVGAAIKQAAKTHPSNRPPVEDVRAALNNIPLPNNGSDELSNAVQHLRNGTKPTDDFIQAGGGSFDLPDVPFN